jgi:hypothetical protein
MRVWVRFIGSRQLPISDYYEHNSTKDIRVTRKREFWTPDSRRACCSGLVIPVYNCEIWNNIIEITFKIICGLVNESIGACYHLLSVVVKFRQIQHPFCDRQSCPRAGGLGCYCSLSLVLYYSSWHWVPKNCSGWQITHQPVVTWVACQFELSQEKENTNTQGFLLRFSRGEENKCKWETDLTALFCLLDWNSQ